MPAERPLKQAFPIISYYYCSACFSWIMQSTYIDFQGSRTSPLCVDDEFCWFRSYNAIWLDSRPSTLHLKGNGGKAYENE